MNIVVLTNYKSIFIAKIQNKYISQFRLKYKPLLLIKEKENKKEGIF